MVTAAALLLRCRHPATTTAAANFPFLSRLPFFTALFSFSFPIFERGAVLATEFLVFIRGET